MSAAEREMPPLIPRPVRFEYGPVRAMHQLVELAEDDQTPSTFQRYLAAG